MRNEDLLLLAAAGLALYWVLQSRGALATTRSGTSARGLSPQLAGLESVFSGRLWPDTEARYAGTWTANGPLNLATYDKQIYD